MSHGVAQPSISERIIDPALTYEDATERILRPCMRRGYHPIWLIGFGISALLLLIGLISTTVLLLRGVGVWGVNVPVAWGFAIINFVWWIGIGHAGTLISAILLLLRQSWRTSINRFAEAMTLFAVACAGLFPLLHLGRITKFYYLLPYPNTLDMWPQWRSPLVWDVFAVMTYGLVSLLFWYIGLLPDLAGMRDRSPRKSVRIFGGIFSLGWRGSARHWQRFNAVYLILAGLATPLVVSVHSIVSLDFSVGIVPGWHSTIFPPYFVAGAIYAGFAMVIILAIPLRYAFDLREIITLKHFDQMAKVMLASGLIVTYGYVMETFTAWFSGEPAEEYLIVNRAMGPYAGIYWTTLICNVVVAQLLWFRWIRRNLLALLLISLAISVGMWGERFVIVVVSLHRDYLPSSWGDYAGTFWDWTLYIGTLGLFATLFFLFVRFLPAVSAFEVRELLHHVRHGGTKEQTATTQEPNSESRSVVRAESGVALHGIMAEFSDPESLVAASRAARRAGYCQMDAYTPFPVEGLPEALGFARSRIPRFAMIGALVGGGGAYFMQWYASVQSYPINIGGRPLHSWPSFVPITFELAVLGAAVFMIVGMILCNRFPRLHHPVFDVPGFDRASTDKFFLVIERRDPAFDQAAIETLFQDTGAERILEVPDVSTNEVKEIPSESPAMAQ